MFSEYIFFEIILPHGCYPVSLLNIFRTPSSKNTSGWLLLNFVCFGAFMQLVARFVFISYKVEVLSVSKQYKQINKNWFITRWKYRSDVFIYAYGCEKDTDTGFPRRMEIINISTQSYIAACYADRCCFSSCK